MIFRFIDQVWKIKKKIFIFENIKILAENTRRLSEYNMNLNLDSSLMKINCKNFNKKILIAHENNIINKALKILVSSIFTEKNESFDIIYFNDGNELINFLCDQTRNDVSIKCIIIDEKIECTDGSDIIKVIRGLEINSKIGKMKIILIKNRDDMTFDNNSNYGADIVLTETPNKNNIFNSFCSLNIIP